MLKMVWIRMMAAVVILMAGWGWMPGEMVSEAAQEKDIQWPGLEVYGDDWGEIDRFLQREAGEQEAVSFTSLVKLIMDGKGKEAGRMILAGIRGALFREIAHGIRLAGELLALGMIGAIFANFSNIFTGSKVSETGFFMTYLLAFTLLAAAFTDSMEITRKVLMRQIEFMRVLLPCYFPVAAWAGGSISAAAWMEFLLFLIALAEWAYLNLLLPLAKAYILLVMAGNIAQENMLSKLTGILRSVIGWGNRWLVGLVLGFHLVQGMVLPYADSIKMGGMQKLLQAIPGVGDGAGAVTKMVVGTGVLVKNTMGAAGVAVLIAVSLTPLLKLAVLLGLYQAVAGILQPIGDRRLTACMGSVADGQKILLGLAASGLVLFVVTIALVCVGTNGAYQGM